MSKFKNLNSQQREKEDKGLMIDSTTILVAVIALVLWGASRYIWNRLLKARKFGEISLPDPNKKRKGILLRTTVVLGLMLERVMKFGPGMINSRHGKAKISE